MIAKILINNMERVVLLLTFKQKLSMLIKIFNTDFISNLSNLCEKILEVFFYLNLKRFWLILCIKLMHNNLMY